MLDEAAASSLDLDTTAILLLNVLDVSSALTHNLRAEIEARNGLKVDRNALFWPFAAAKGVAFDLRLLRLATAESSLVDEVRQVLLLELFDLGNGLLQTVFGQTSDVEVEGRSLRMLASRHDGERIGGPAYARRGHALVRVVVPAGGDIFLSVSEIEPK